MRFCLIFVACVLFASCSSLPPASFPKTPQTIEPGSLNGPFHGKIIRSDNASPIEEVLVIGCWGNESPSESFFPIIDMTRTNNNGEFHFFRRAFKKTTKISIFQFIAYKKGFEAAVNSTTLLPDQSISDFAQQKGTIRLTPFNAANSRMRHLAFIKSACGWNGTHLPSWFNKVFEEEIALAQQELSAVPSASIKKDRVASEPPKTNDLLSALNRKSLLMKVLKGLFKKGRLKIDTNELPRITLMGAQNSLDTYATLNNRAIIELRLLSQPVPILSEDETSWASKELVPGDPLSNVLWQRAKQRDTYVFGTKLARGVILICHKPAQSNCNKIAQRLYQASELRSN